MWLTYITFGRCVSLLAHLAHIHTMCIYTRKFLVHIHTLSLSDVAYDSCIHVWHDSLIYGYSISTSCVNTCVYAPYSHVTHMNESCPTYEWVMSRIHTLALNLFLLPCIVYSLCVLVEHIYMLCAHVRLLSISFSRHAHQCFGTYTTRCKTVSWHD